MIKEKLNLYLQFQQRLINILITLDNSENLSKIFNELQVNSKNGW